VKKIIRLIAYFFPSPINVWIHKLAGSTIGKHVSIHPGVLLLVDNMEIKDNAIIKFGSFINARTLELGRKSSIGFFTLVNGKDDLIIKDACIIGARTMINCDRSVTFEYYSGNGPGCYLYTHGSFLPVTEGYRAVFAPITIKEKVWIQMNCKIGPGVTIGKGSVVLPGTVLVENVEPNKMVVGDPAKLTKIPLLRKCISDENIKDFGLEILSKYCEWSNEYKKTNWKLNNGVLLINEKRKKFSVCVDGEGDIVLFTEPGKKNNGMYFNLRDLTTDNSMHPEKVKLEQYIRLYFGLTFLD
jgi:acetyltransferase-like isoleucine patch superfamily enzyme